jgi:hypothetical protein
LCFASVGPGSAELSHVILDGFTLPNPSSGQGLVPAGLLGTAKGPHFLSLQDVRVLVDQPTLQQHVDHFAKLENVTTYTVSANCLDARHSGEHPQVLGKRRLAHAGCS